MEFTVNRQPELMMDPVWLLTGAILLAVSAVFFVMLPGLKIKHTNKAKVQHTPPAGRQPRELIKARTVQAIDKILFDLSRSDIDIRESYQRLSMIMRNFVTDYTGKDVTSLTLSELKMAGDKRFVKLVEKWYAPEFAMKTKADFRNDAEQAKRVVKTWN